MTRLFRGSLLAMLAVITALTFTMVSADARSMGSMGSRGGRTFSMPSGTATAPRAAPIQRSTTLPQSGVNQGYAGGYRPGGFFGGGMLGGLATGFLTAGVLGMLFGHGFFGGMAGFGSILGMILQIGLIVILARLAWGWFTQRRPSYASGPAMRQGMSGGGFGGFGGFGGGGAGAGSSAPAGTPIQVAPADFDTFERLLNEVQTAYGQEDIAALRSRVTPEMLSYYSEELSQNASRGVVNRIANVKLVQGDLSEAWQEGADEYATVAMRYQLDDKMYDRASGRVVEQEPSEAREFWTFRRVHGGNWVVSAVQQS